MINKKLKIAVMVDQLVPGGVQKSAIREARELVKLGFEVTLVVLVRLNYSYQYQDLSRDLKVIYLSDFNPKLFRRAIRIPYFAFLTNLHIINPYFTHRYAILKNYDLIISHGTTTCITARAIYRHLHVPYVAFIWDPMLFILEKVYSKTPIKFFFPIIKPLIYLYERSFLDASLLVATSSKVHQQFLQKKYHIEPVIIHPGCVSFPRNILPKSGQYILGYTRWELAKNPQLFLWLAKKLPSTRFLIAGSWNNPKEELYFKDLIKRYKLQKQVVLFTPGSEQNIKKMAQNSLVWLHPNFEAFGMSGLEMAACGLPLIIPQNSGLTEIFTSGIHGFFPRHNSKSEYLEILKYMLKNPDETREMGIQAAQVARKLTWKKHTREVVTYIRLLLHKPQIAVLETCRVMGSALSGGDKLMTPMAEKISGQFNFSVITSYHGAYHWQKEPFVKKIIVLPKNIFDLGSNPIPVFLTYCLRMWSATVNLLKLYPEIIYSSTNILPDVLPGFISKKKHNRTIWIARIHHLIPPPHKRQGNLIVNIVSFFMQMLALKLIKTGADNIIALNYALKTELLHRGFPERKLTVLGAGINPDKISATPHQVVPKFTGVFLGRLHTAKGIFDLVPIWKQVVSIIPEAKLAVIGDGPQIIEKQLKQQIIKYKMTESILFLGFLPENQVINIMRRAKVFLFTDHESGWGLAVAEAMACGLPVVGYDLGILGSVFKQGFIKIPAFDLPAFSLNLIDILNHPSDQLKLSRQAMEEAKKHSWSKTVRQFQSIVKNTKITNL